jgi:RibD C-terminal domain
MAKLIYSAIASADGYVEDAGGSFDWGAPGEELFCFVNDLERLVGTYLYGRRMYETMLYWETAHTVPGQPSFVREFTGIWQAAGKIVFSTTLQSVSSARTRIDLELITSQHAPIKIPGDEQGSSSDVPALPSSCHDEP